MILNSQTRGEGRAVILIHGLFGASDNLGNLARSLESDFRVISLDLRNHGRSPWAEGMAFPELAADVFETLDSLGVYACDLVGHSLGGKVAMACALSGSAKVEVGKVVAADIAPVAYGGGRHDTVFAALEAVPLESIASRSDALTVLRQHLVEPGVAEFLAKNLQRDGDGFRWRMNLQGLRRDYDQVIQALEGHFDGEILFIKGSHSDYILHEHEAAIRERFANPQFRMIQGTGHWLHAEKPAAFNRLVHQFLKSD